MVWFVSCRFFFRFVDNFVCVLLMFGCRVCAEEDPVDGRFFAVSLLIPTLQLSNKRGFPQVYKSTGNAILRNSHANANSNTKHLLNISLLFCSSALGVIR